MTFPKNWEGGELMLTLWHQFLLRHFYEGKHRIIPGQGLNLLPKQTQNKP